MKKPCPCPKLLAVSWEGGHGNRWWLLTWRCVMARMRGHLQGRMAALLLYQGPAYTGCVPTTPGRSQPGLSLRSTARTWATASTPTSTCARRSPLFPSRSSAARAWATATSDDAGSESPVRGVSIELQEGPDRGATITPEALARD